jgi:PhzF family phenazine biosynthesis protein
VSAPIPIIQADIFTTRPFSGNPAAAVLDADGLDEASMQRIAAEMLVPGTAFVSAPPRAGVDWRLRMFTPKREVAYSGHTALCVVHALLETGRLPGAHVVFDTPSGLLRVEVDRADEGTLMWLERHRSPPAGRSTTTSSRFSPRSACPGPGSGAGRGRR